MEKNISTLCLRGFCLNCDTDSNFWRSTPSYKASKINLTNVRLETFWLFKAKHGKKLLVVATDLQKFQKLN